jgi:replication-associated recombination protein RarA
MAALYERYRPVTLDDVVGQPRAVAMLKRTPPGGNVLLLAAGSGSGKTSIARIVAYGFAEKWHVEEVDAQDCTLHYLREMEREMHYKGLGTMSGKAWIINEAHGLRGAIVSRFLTLIEAMPSHVCLMFTTTRRPQASLFADHDDADPFFSRCLRVPLAWHEHAPNVAGPLTKAFAERAMTIAQAEGLDGGKPLAAFIQLALDCRHNLREMLSRIQAGAMLPEQRDAA